MLWAFTVVHALNCVLNEDYEAGLEWANHTLQIPAAIGYWPHAVKASALANLGLIDDARKVLATAIHEKSDFSVAFVLGNMPTKHADGLKPYIDGLRKAGLQ
jgi:adenylate cyclase